MNNFNFNKKLPKPIEYNKLRIDVGLMAAKGLEKFYKNFGFIERPNNYFVPGMTQFWGKKKEIKKSEKLFFTALKKCNSDMEKRILHGLELRERTHPEEILPILKNVLQNNINKKTKEIHNAKIRGKNESIKLCVAKNIINVLTNI